MKAWLMATELWGYVDGKTPKPSDDGPELATWQTKSAKAAGWIYLMVDDTQNIHLQHCSEDSVKMWQKLSTIHLQQKPGARFNAYDDLFSIRKQEDESLPVLMNRVDDAIRKIKNLRPDTFKLDTLDSELASMAMIRALPEDYAPFVSSLLMKDTLTTDVVEQAFITEDIQRQRRADSTSVIQANVTITPAPTISCTFCGLSGHLQPQCFKFQRAQKQVKEEMAQKRSKKRSKTPENAQLASSITLSTSARLTDFDWCTVTMVWPCIY